MINYAEKELRKMMKINFMSSTIDLIKKIVAKEYNVSYSNVYKSKTRIATIIEIKHVAIYASHEILKSQKVTVRFIGSKFENLKYGAVDHAIKKIRGQMKIYPELQQKVNSIILTLNSAIREANSESSLVLSSEYYFINMDKIQSIKVTDLKSVILVGYSPEEAESFCRNQRIDSQIRHHSKTGMYILDTKI